MLWAAFPLLDQLFDERALDLAPIAVGVAIALTALLLGLLLCKEEPS